MSFILTALLVVFFFAILVLGHEFGHFLMARILKMEVQEFGFGLPPKITSRKIGKTEYSLNAIPFGGFVRIEDLEPKEDEQPTKRISIWKRTLVFASGVIVNFIIGWMAFTLIYTIGASPAVYVSAVEAGSSAENAGIKAGDRFVDFNNIDSLVKFIQNRPGENISWEIDRYGEKIAITAAPRATNEGAKLGVELVESGFEKQGIFAAAYSGLTVSLQFTWRIISSFVYMFRNGDFSSSSGPVGVWNAVAVAKDMGVVYLLQLLGVVSLNLMVINFLPLPALDGGHVLFLAIEKIRRKPISFKTQSVINSTSFILLLILMFVVTIRDVIRLF